MSSSNMCQCCLIPECSKDIFNEYFYNGKKEVYADMLLNTLNINVLQDNNMICDNCIAELRRATEFKMRIMKSANYLSRMRHMKIDNQYHDDFDDKISVDFEDSQPVSQTDTGQVFLIKLNTTNCFYDQHNNSEDLEFEADEETTVNQVSEPTRLSKGRKKIDHQKASKSKIKQPESQTHKDLQQNSLKLVFNSNLCLFKSLKTKFGCFLCRDAFLTIKELREHSKIHRNNELIRAKFNRLRGLSYQNADISSLECLKCNQSCLDLIDLKKHLIKQHGVEFGNVDHFLIPYRLEDSFDCVLCSEKFNTYMRLSVHMNNHYSNNVCEICGNSYINRISLRIHLQSRHREKKCSLCPETFLTNYGRVRHMRTHHNSCVSKRHCLICGKTFRYSYQLMEHKIQDHGAKRQMNKCSLCPKMFPNTQNLKIHVRSVHVRERNFPCSTCEMRFFTKFDQRRHEKTHVDERSFACGLCESKFKGKDSLRRHLKRQHLGI